MPGQIYRISREQAAELHPNIDAGLQDFIDNSTEVYAGLYDREMICLMGLIPISIITGDAYLWLRVSPLVTSHRIAFARHAKHFVAAALTRYTTLHGHCNTESAVAWLGTLGAIFYIDPRATELNPLIKFEITRHGPVLAS